VRKVNQASRGRAGGGALLAAALLLTAAPPAGAEEAAVAASTQAAGAPAPQPRLEVSGFAMLDMGYQSGQNHPDWFDVVRPTKLPAFPNEFGEDGRFFAGVRQSRLGVKGFVPTAIGELRTNFEFEMFGTGVDAGQTTFRLRHAWGELGQIGAGQTWSPFMDPDVFPNSVEYWGPNGMVFFRNVQLRWTPWTSGDGSRFVVALERPGASADQGDFAGRIELEGVRGRFPLPDLSAHYRHVRGWGHVQVAGIVRQMKWDDLNDDQFDLSGDATGWGINLSSNLKLAGKHVARLQVAFGEGVQNYWNDAPVDVGIRNNFADPRTPVLGEALPILGVVAFLDSNWTPKWSTTVGYSLVDIDNTDGQSDDAYKTGQYFLANLMHYPVAGVMLGPEIQWGKRENFRDGFTSDDFRIQFSAKYNFGLSLGGK
jgi:hypothetical protein